MSPANEPKTGHHEGLEALSASTTREVYDKKIALETYEQVEIHSTINKAITYFDQGRFFETLTLLNELEIPRIKEPNQEPRPIIEPISTERLEEIRGKLSDRSSEAEQARAALAYQFIDQWIKILQDATGEPVSAWAYSSEDLYTPSEDRLLYVLEKRAIIPEFLLPEPAGGLYKKLAGNQQPAEPNTSIAGESDRMHIFSVVTDQIREAKETLEVLHVRKERLAKTKADLEGRVQVVKTSGIPRPVDQPEDSQNSVPTKEEFLKKAEKALPQLSALLSQFDDPITYAESQKTCAEFLADESNLSAIWELRQYRDGSILSNYGDIINPDQDRLLITRGEVIITFLDHTVIILEPGDVVGLQLGPSGRQYASVTTRGDTEVAVIPEELVPTIDEYITRQIIVSRPGYQDISAHKRAAEQFGIALQVEMYPCRYTSLSITVPTFGPDEAVWGENLNQWSGDYLRVFGNRNQNGEREVVVFFGDGMGHAEKGAREGPLPLDQLIKSRGFQEKVLRTEQLPGAKLSRIMGICDSFLPRAVDNFGMFGLTCMLINVDRQRAYVANAGHLRLSHSEFGGFRLRHTELNGSVLLGGDITDPAPIEEINMAGRFLVGFTDGWHHSADRIAELPEVEELKQYTVNTIQKAFKTRLSQPDLPNDDRTYLFLALA